MSEPTVTVRLMMRADKGPTVKAEVSAPRSHIERQVRLRLLSMDRQLKAREA